MGIKKMRIRIGLDGRTTIRVEGGEGSDCLSFTRAVEQALGPVEQREMTADAEAHDPLAVQAREDLNVRDKL